MFRTDWDAFEQADRLAKKQKEVDKLTTRIERLEAALKYYAESDEWYRPTGIETAMTKKFEYTAREALKKDE